MLCSLTPCPARTASSHYAAFAYVQEPLTTLPTHDRHSRTHTCTHPGQSCDFVNYRETHCQSCSFACKGSQKKTLKIEQWKAPATTLSPASTICKFTLRSNSARHPFELSSSLQSRLEPWLAVSVGCLLQRPKSNDAEKENNYFQLVESLPVTSCSCTHTDNYNHSIIMMQSTTAHWNNLVLAFNLSCTAVNLAVCIYIPGKCPKWRVICNYQPLTLKSQFYSLSLVCNFKGTTLSRKKWSENHHIAVVEPSRHPNSHVHGVR